MKCLIFTNGYIDDYSFINLNYKDYYIISCDGGLRHIDKLNITPNILVGDFDSVDKHLLQKYSNIKTLQYPCDKDYTDTELGILHAKEKGFKDILILGATGGRLDHTLGNVFLLKKGKDLGLNIVLCDSLQEIHYIDKDNFTINNYKNKTLSIIPIENIKCNFSKGLLYPLDDLNFNVGDTRSISNVVTSEKVCISFKEGKGLIIIKNKKD